MNALSDQKIGEMSTPYLYLYDKSISTMAKYFNDFAEIKIIILLRNPVDRAYSQYKWRVRDGREPLHFSEAINAEKERMNGKFSFDYFYVDRGFYYNQVKAYKDNFKNVHIVFFEDFNNDPSKSLTGICRFLNVDESMEFKSVRRQNESLAPRSAILGRLLTMEIPFKYKLLNLLPDSLRRNLKRFFSDVNTSRRKVKKMDPLLRKKLIETYREDILALQQLLGHDLSEWLK